MKFFEEVEQVSPEIYYHYTTTETLYEIIGSKTFRLTNIKLPRGKKEAVYKPEQFVADLENVIASESDEDRKNCFSLVKKSIANNEAKFLRECRSPRSAYALCMSEKKDGITYWERYAAGCTGVCIGFNAATLKEYLRRMEAPALVDGLFDVGKAVCTEEARIKYIRDGLNRAYDVLCKYGGKKPVQKYLGEVMEGNGYGYAAGMYLQLVKFTHKDSFLDEYEVRLYHDTAFIKSALQLIDLLETDMEAEESNKLRKHFTDVTGKWKLEEEQFCVTKNGILGCKNLCLEEIWGSGIISEIILGPLCPQSSSELKRFLKANGLEGTKVSASKVVMR